MPTEQREITLADFLVRLRETARRNRFSVLRRCFRERGLGSTVLSELVANVFTPRSTPITGPVFTGR